MDGRTETSRRDGQTDIDGEIQTGGDKQAIRQASRQRQTEREREREKCSGTARQRRKERKIFWYSIFLS